jgi:hypothetical protein
MAAELFEGYDPFPRGKWAVEIDGVAAMSFEGCDLLPTEFGLFMTHSTKNEGQEVRHSFVPWHRVKRAYTLREP